MSTVDTLFASVQAAAGSPLVSSLLVISTSIILFCLLALVSTGTAYLTLLGWASYERPAQSAPSSKSQLSSDKREQRYGFNENALFIVFYIQLAALWSALGALASMVVSGGRKLVEFVISNLPLILGLLAIFPLVIAWETYHEILLENIGEVYNCFIAPILRPLFLPVVNLYALFFGSVLPINNAVREVVVGVTTTTIVRTLVCAGAATQALALQLVTIFTTFAAALTAWLQQSNQQAFYIAPDFQPTGVEIGVFIADLQLFADCACQPLSQVAFEPFFDPFETPEFANAVNQTLNVPVVFVTQGLVRPVLQTFLNAGATPGAPFGDILSRPSFNSSFDVTTASALGIGNVLDLFGVSLYQLVVNAVTAIFSSCPPLDGWTNTAPCRSGVVEGLCNALECTTESVVPVGCCRSSIGFCAGNQTEAACNAPGSTFTVGSCLLQTTCITGEITGCCVRDIVDMSPNQVAGLCIDNTLALSCFGDAVDHKGGLTCDQALAADPFLSCTNRLPGALTLTEQRSCGGCPTDGEVCTCSDCLCEYQTDTLFGVNSCASGTDPSTCQVQFDSLTPPLVPSFFTGVAGLTDAMLIQPLRIIFNALWNIDIVFTTFDGYLYFDIQSVVDAAHSGISNLTAPLEWFAQWLEDLGELAAEQLTAPPSESLVVRSAPSVRLLTHLHPHQLDATLGVTGELLQDALDVLAAIVRVPRDFFIALFDFGFELLQLFINLIFGSAWLTADTAVNSSRVDPLAYAKLLWGDNIDLATTFRCVATSSSASPVDLFGMQINDASATPCNLEMAALSYCRFVFQSAVAQSDTSVGAERDALDGTPAFITVNLIGATPTLRSDVVACVGSAVQCRPSVIPSDPLPLNVYEENLNNVVAMASAFDPLVGSFCVECAQLQNVFTDLAQPFVPFVLPVIDVLVHIDLLFSTSYVKCLDLISSAEAVEDFVAAFTNLFREIQFGINDSNVRCATGNAARDSRIFCVLAQGVDATVQIFTNLFSVLWNVAQKVVELIEGTSTDATELVNLLDIVSFEVPIRTLAFDFAAIILQIIPITVECATPGCCQLAVFSCFPQQFENECGAGAFFPDQTCNSLPLLCGVDDVGCCQTRNTFSTGALNQARFCLDEVPSSQCNNPDQVFSGARCDTIGGSLVCPASTKAQTVTSDAFGVLISDLLLFFPRITINTLRELARIILDFSMDDPFTALIEAFFTPIFAVIGNVFDQLARLLFCAGAGESARTFFDIGAAVVDILDFGLTLLTDLVLLVFYLVFGIIQAVTTGSTAILEQAADLLLRVSIFFLFAIFGPDATCGLQDFLCDVCFFSGCDQSVAFAIRECREYACCSLNVDTSNICVAHDGFIKAPTCNCNAITPTPRTNCNAMPAVVCPDARRKRNSLQHENPFTALLAKEVEQSKRRSADEQPPLPSEEFCGSFLATYGIDNARDENATVSSTAAACLRVLENSAHKPSVRDEIKAFLRDSFSSAYTTSQRLVSIAQVHWADMTAEAREEADHQLAVARRNPDALLADKTRAKAASVRSALRDYRNYEPVNVGKRTPEDFFTLRSHLKVLTFERSREMSHVAIVQAMSTAMRVGHVWTSPFALVGQFVERGRDKLVARAQHIAISTLRTNQVRLQLGFRLAIYHAGAYAQRLSEGLGRAIGRVMPKLQRTPVAPAAPLLAQARSSVRPQFVDNSTLGLIDLPECNVSVQNICTGCLVLDDAIRITQQSVNGLIDFYPDNETGYLSYVDRFTEGIDNTLVNPFGNDTFTTVDKRVPWIGERFATVRWFWQWNYTQFLTIIGGANGTSVPSNQTELLQQQRAAAAGRPDYDIFFIDQFGRVIRPLLNIIESLIGVVVDAGEDESVLSELFVTYIQCDYEGALQCRSETLGVGLFDAVVNVFLIYIIVGTVLVSVNVMFGFSLFVLLLPFAYTLTMWVAYGASPLCTTPSFVLGLVGIPTCLPADIYTLVSETLQQCPVVPISLIVPSELAAAGETLCTACGQVPAMVNCAQFGFLNGLDVFFYSAPSIFGDGFNAQAASLLGGVAPDIAAVAALYTPDYIAALGEAGLVCNRIMLPSLLTAAGIVAARVALVGALLLSLALLAVAAFWLTWTILLWINEVVRQVDEGFVQQTRVEKLKFKEN